MNLRFPSIEAQRLGMVAELGFRATRPIADAIVGWSVRKEGVYEKASVRSYRPGVLRAALEAVISELPGKSARELREEYEIAPHPDLDTLRWESRYYGALASPAVPIAAGLGMAQIINSQRRHQKISPANVWHPIQMRELHHSVDLHYDGDLPVYLGDLILAGRVVHDTTVSQIVASGHGI